MSSQAISSSEGTPRRICHILAASSYALVVLGLFGGAAWLAANLYDDAAETAELRERLQMLEQRSSGVSRPANVSAADAEAGSPLIQGATITQAGADLQQRMERAVARRGGTLLSSQVALQDAQGTPGFLSLSADLELPEPELQAFLYDIEAGMPYLFVDAFSVRAPEAADEGKVRRLRVAINVSGKWEGRQ